MTNLRDLLPLPQSTRQRLSQLQLMALVCVYVRKANYFQQGECSSLLINERLAANVVLKLYMVAMCVAPQIDELSVRSFWLIIGH